MVHLETREEQVLDSGAQVQSLGTAAINLYPVPVSPLQWGAGPGQSVPCHTVPRDEHLSRPAEVSGGRDAHTGTGKVI